MSAQKYTNMFDKVTNAVYVRNFPISAKHYTVAIYARTTADQFRHECMNECCSECTPNVSKFTKMVKPSRADVALNYYIPLNIHLSRGNTATGQK